jgi:hypothetical protein
MAWVIAIFVFAALVWVLVEGAAVLGFFGALMNERIERCRHCGRVGLTSNHTMHPNGCPQTLVTRLRHAWVGQPHHLHSHSPH